MSTSVSVTSPPPPAGAIPTVLENLPDIPLRGGECPRRARQQLDLMLLAIESLQLGGSEVMLAVARDLSLLDVLKNRVYLWQIRSSNPMRRWTQRRSLSPLEAKALVAIICYMSRRLTVVVRELLLAAQQLSGKGQPLANHFRLADYLERFRAHFRSRMNPKRSAVLVYGDDDRLNALALELLRQLLFCTGTSGTQRFWISLFDGEV
ncbi:DUF3038 domain-containing protein [Prochlorothrix hollandica]|uniref:DUF3038 domain-containing protein n=1 Tax=Prochlorothrix hollandica PCC 9006 = CALU 1027 TaxID=317619 RepID=A0A0M2PVI8_PROHO|nr:DUF3038 domain-containing protein [Prochlorothrix hollandica]KKI98698.1 hypothetical protein PROH_17800 [Prochlorothrix hollandica PCC 9006 = CALU 1027]